jgi:uncharacterized integral membrane protein (TIGR00697 family)
MSKAKVFQNRSETLYLLLSAIFLTSLVMGNIVGTTKFVTLFTISIAEWFLPFVPDLVHANGIYSMVVPIGVLVYPVTFLATDLLSELYGAAKTQRVVWIGFFMNLFMLLALSIGHWLPDASGISGALSTFEEVYRFMIGNTLASMIAYLTAQSIDVKLFHFWKKLTHGRHLWLRNNGSTMVSQMVDSIAILSILYVAGNLGDSVKGISDLVILIINSYLFKFLFALLDTPLFYLSTAQLTRYLNLKKTT